MRDIVNLLATSLPPHCHLTFLARKLTVLANLLADVGYTGYSRMSLSTPKSISFSSDRALRSPCTVGHGRRCVA